jgi:hypothetical protein
MPTDTGTLTIQVTVTRTNQSTDKMSAHFTTGNADNRPPTASAVSSVYHVDLNDPGFAERWRELQHAERAERRQARAEWRNDQAWERRKHQLLDAHGQANVSMHE